jgi:hypothetical protein
MQAKTRRLALVVLAGGVVFTAALAVGSPASAAASKVPLCHAKGSTYIWKSVPSRQIIGGSGHGGHARDIIPTFDYDGGHFVGRNWTAEGRAIWNNGACNGNASQPPASSSSSSSTEQSTSSSTEESTSSSSQSTEESTSSSSQNTDDSTSSSDQTPPPANSSDESTTSVPTEVAAVTIDGTQPPADSPKGSTPAPVDPPAGVDHLARTGNGLVEPMTLAGILALGLGTGLVVVAARRRTHSQ